MPDLMAIVSKAVLEKEVAAPRVGVLGAGERAEAKGSLARRRALRA